MSLRYLMCWPTEYQKRHRIRTVNKLREGKQRERERKRERERELIYLLKENWPTSSLDARKMFLGEFFFRTKNFSR